MESLGELLGKVLALNETQTSVLSLVFKFCELLEPFGLLLCQLLEPRPVFFH